MPADRILPYAHQSITTADIEEVTKALKGEMITRGHYVDEFEREFARYCGATYAVAFSNGSSALLAACYAAKTGPFDRILTTPNTFVISVGAGIRYNANPVFIDIDRDTGNLNLEHLEYNIEYHSTRGKNIILPVHFAGIPIDMRKLERTVKDPQSVIIEDAAHALGSSYPDGGPKVGSCEWSHMTVFSFHAVKTITTGEGGMVTTNDETFYRLLQLFRNNGIERNPAYLAGEPAPWYYEVQDLTCNYNFTEFQAALGLSQMRRLDEMVAKRRKLVKAYRERLKNFASIRLLTAEFDEHTAFHLFVVQIDFAGLKTTRTEVMLKLKESGIGTQLHYIPVYRHPALKRICGDLVEYFPEMEGYYQQALSLPLFVDMEISDVDRVVEILKKVINKNF